MFLSLTLWHLFSFFVSSCLFVTSVISPSRSSSTSCSVSSFLPLSDSALRSSFLAVGITSVLRRLFHFLLGPPHFCATSSSTSLCRPLVVLDFCVLAIRTTTLDINCFLDLLLRYFQGLLFPTTSFCRSTHFTLGPLPILHAEPPQTLAS